MADKFIICDEIIAPISNVICIEKWHGTSYRVTMRDKNYTDIKAESFKQIQENLINKNKTVISELKKKISALECYILYSPGGVEFLKAQEHYESVTNFDK